MEIISEPDGSYSVRQTDTGLVVARGLELEEANIIVAVANRARLRRLLAERLTPDETPGQR